MICPQPPNISNGRILSDNLKESYTIEDMLRYECIGGYNLFRETITCQNDGSWSATPICLLSIEVELAELSFHVCINTDALSVVIHETLCRSVIVK